MPWLFPFSPESCPLIPAAPSALQCQFFEQRQIKDDDFSLCKAGDDAFFLEIMKDAKQCRSMYPDQGGDFALGHGAGKYPAVVMAPGEIQDEAADVGFVVAGTHIGQEGVMDQHFYPHRP